MSELLTWIRGAIDRVVAFVGEHPVWFGWLAGISAVMFLVSIVAIPFAVSRMRADYFVARRPSEDSWWMQHRVIRYTLLVSKNLLGGILLVSGLAMLVLPGQGIITILVAITLLDFPGKRRFELRIVRMRRVHKAIDWLRARAKRPPLLLPDPESDDDR